MIELDRNPTAAGTFDGEKTSRDSKDVTGENVGLFVEFEVSNDRAVTLRVGNSFLSYEQAERNLKQEAAGGFDAVRQRGADEWDKSLAQVAVKGGTEAPHLLLLSLPRPTLPAQALRARRRWKTRPLRLLQR